MERQTRLRRVAVVPVFLVVVALSPPSVAYGDEWGTGTVDTGPIPDGGTHRYCWGAGFNSGLHDNATFAMQQSLDADTDATVEHQACDYTAPGTDVVWLDADLPGSTRGQSVCFVFNTNGRCDRNHVTLDPAQLNLSADPQGNRTKTACHEVGHTVGLRHGPGGGDGRFDDCMVSGESTLVRYSSHHRGHINAYF